jgi:hypothetical protein
LDYNGTTPQLFIGFKEAYDSVRSEVLYSIPIEFAVATKLVRLPFFNFALECTIRKFQDNQLVYADDVNLQGDDIETINRNTETLVHASMEVGLELKVEKKQKTNSVGLSPQAKSTD